jgi:hypothetical protein
MLLVVRYMYVHIYNTVTKLMINIVSLNSGLLLMLDTTRYPMPSIPLSPACLEGNYRSVLGKRPWVLYHKSLISLHWALTRYTGRLPYAKIEIGGVNIVGVAVS